MKRKTLAQISELKKNYKIIAIGVDIVDYAYISKSADEAGMPISAYVKRVLAMGLNAEREAKKNDKVR